MAEGLFLELVGENNKPVGLGELGAILVTDLLNHAMPMIRYRIGDAGFWAQGTCRCGRFSPRLQRVVGRVTEMLVGSDGRLVSGVFLATYVVAQRPSLGQVQIHQDKPGSLTYHVKPSPQFQSSLELDYLRAATQRYLGQDASVSVVLVDEILPEASGKFVFSHSTVSPGYLQPRTPLN
jgi:phenylacetate-CoA ligase